MSNDFLKTNEGLTITEPNVVEPVVVKTIDDKNKKLPLCPKCKQKDMVSYINATGYIGEKLYKCHRCGFDNQFVFSAESTSQEQIASIDEILIKPHEKY